MPEKSSDVDDQPRSLHLADGAVATLVRRRAQQASCGAVLYVHGFADYFFQEHVAAHFTAQGFDFYGLDLRRYGRSLTEEDTPNFVADLAEHFVELDEAARIIRAEDGHQSLVVIGHSTGGLIAALWAHARRNDHVLDALVLNSPWLELAEPWIMQTLGTTVIDVIGRFAPKFLVRKGLGPVYGESIHRDYHGEWDFNLQWKPLAAFPVLAGWLRAVRRGQALLHRGLDVRVPVLVLRSDKSLSHQKHWVPEAMSADTVLDVAHMAQFGPRIGQKVTVVTVSNGMHDLFLSAEPVRNQALSEVDSWLVKQFDQDSQ